ncbi:MAG: hypothetical protein ABJN35_08375 [Erythrobacter sp.]|uniref:hypothetical protein n=1 Tax=Erythrobacter sp. Alg231-14 TaxID=1922225 RepID=UPI000D55F819
MMDPTFVTAAACLFGICMVGFMALRGWQDWLALKRQELDRLHAPAGHYSEIEGGAINASAGGVGSGVGAARIELADMKERIKKLEAIASGVEL